MIAVKNGSGKARIVVAGVGGGGNNAIIRMVQDDVSGVELLGINTEDKAINALRSYNTNVLQIGENLTRGLGAGAKPEIGEKAAEESRDAIREALAGADMVILTCGMGGGTGTGATPVVARIAKELGILTIGVVTKPFDFEGSIRMRNATKGIERLKEYTDTLIVIPNTKLLKLVERNTPITEALWKADEVLRQTVQGITDIVNVTSDINLDMRDLETIMRGKGIAHIGIGTGRGENRALEAVKVAIASPLLETSIKGATDVILSFSGDLALIDVSEAAEYVHSQTGEDSNTIFGSRFDRSDPDTCSITLIATGIKD